MSIYNRNLAVQYAKKWAFGRNPQCYNYDNIGGDCTNFISQCLYAGINKMNYDGYGWYYINANNKSPSWTGVEFLYKFLINNKTDGPRGILTGKNKLEIGDIIQLSFSNNIFGHSLIVTSINEDNIKVSTHTIDAFDRNLNTYTFEKARFIHII